MRHRSTRFIAILLLSALVCGCATPNTIPANPPHDLVDEAVVWAKVFGRILESQDVAAAKDAAGKSAPCPGPSADSTQ